jgi:hypothetical protein
MSTSVLNLHSGGHGVTREQLALVPTPPATATYFPVSHLQCVTSVEQVLTDSGFAIRQARYALARNDQRLFATLDLESPIAEGVTVAVGVRNSTDKSFPLGFVAGSRVFVCSNLAFRSELLVRKKHTRNGALRFAGEIASAVKTLATFQKHEASRVIALQRLTLTNETAESLMLRSFEGGMISHRVLPKVIGEWRKPSFADFEPRTAWSLLNAFTTALAPKSKSAPQEYARITMRLGGLIDDAAGLKPFALADAELANAS